MEGDGHSPYRDPELEAELLPSHLEEVTLVDREPVRVACYAAAAVSLGAAAVALAHRSRCAAGFGAAATAIVLSGDCTTEIFQ